MKGKDEIEIFTKETNVKKPSGLILIKNKMNLVEHKTYNYLIKVANKAIKDLSDEQKEAHKGIFTTSFDDLIKMMNIINKTDVVKGLDNLLNNSLTGDNVILKKGQEKWNIRTNFLSEWKYQNEKDEIIFQLPNSILELMLDKNTLFADLNLVEVSKLTKKHSIWFYEMINDYKNLGQKTYAVDEIRYLSGIDEGVYPRVTDLRKYIVDVAIDEINRKTSFDVKYVMHKKGRNIISFTFIFKDKSKDRMNEKKVFVTWLKTKFLGKKLSDKFYGDLTFKEHKKNVYMYYFESNKIMNEELAFEIYDYLYIKKNDVFKSYQKLRLSEGKEKSKFKNIDMSLIAFEDYMNKQKEKGNK